MWHLLPAPTTHASISLGATLIAGTIGAAVAPKAELRQGRWFALRESDWIAVPDNKIIRESNPTVEGAHLCYSAGIIVCFLPPNTGG
jgi:hypothetical protein